MPCGLAGMLSQLALAIWFGGHPQYTLRIIVAKAANMVPPCWTSTRTGGYGGSHHSPIVANSAAIPHRAGHPRGPGGTTLVAPTSGQSRKHCFAQCWTSTRTKRWYYRDKVHMRGASQSFTTGLHTYQPHSTTFSLIPLLLTPRTQIHYND